MNFNFKPGILHIEDEEEASNLQSEPRSTKVKIIFQALHFKSDPSYSMYFMISIHASSFMHKNMRKV